MKKKVHVLLVLDQIDRNSGVSSVVMNYYANIDRSKVSMDFLLYEKPKDRVVTYLEKNGSNVYASGQPTKLGLQTYQRVIQSFFKEHEDEYQVVHVHIPNAAFVVLRYAKKYGVQTRIIHSHNSRGADGRIKKIRNFVLNKKGISYANQYFACSKSAGEFLFGKKHSEKVNVVHNAISQDKYKFDCDVRTRMRRQLEIGENTLLLGHVGRFVPQKNHSFLIKIAKCLKDKNIDFKMLLLGGGELENQIREQVASEGLQGQVIFAGVVSNAKEYMDAMDIFVLPSLYEGLPCVCVEAQANGLPCLISSNVTKEVELSEKVRFLDITDPDQWVNAILELSKVKRMEKNLKETSCFRMHEYDIILQAKILEEKYLSYGNSTDTNVDI